jgi:hypothetical protein
MQFSSLTLRSFTVAAALAGAAASAHADLTIPTNALVADSVQAFSQKALNAFTLFGISIAPLGNATEVAGAATQSFDFPITTITINSKLKVVKGDAKGSALEISRTVENAKVGVILANFTINYETAQVLADTTPIGGVTTSQMPLYTFNTATPLAIKYKFPLTITGHEVLDTLKMSDQMQAALKTALQFDEGEAGLADIVVPTLDFGTLTQDILVKFRKAVSSKPYVPTF